MKLSSSKLFDNLGYHKLKNYVILGFGVCVKTIRVHCIVTLVLSSMHMHAFCTISYAGYMFLHVLPISRSLCTVIQRGGVICLSPMSFLQWWKYTIDLRYSRKHSVLHVHKSQALYTRKGQTLYLCVNHVHTQIMHTHKNTLAQTGL